MPSHPTPRQRNRGLEIACELLKLLRTQALSRPQIERTLGYSQVAVARYARELEANGLLHSWLQDTEGRKGKSPRLYAVAPAWGGTTGSAA